MEVEGKGNGEDGGGEDDVREGGQCRKQNRSRSVHLNEKQATTKNRKYKGAKDQGRIYVREMGMVGAVRRKKKTNELEKRMQRRHEAGRCTQTTTLSQTRSSNAPTIWHRQTIPMNEMGGAVFREQTDG